MHLDEPTDEALLAAVAAHDEGTEDALAALYDRWSPRLLALIVQVVIDRAHGEEVLQEVFLEVWRTAGSFDPERGSARGWLATMARRRAIDRVRSVQAARDRETRWQPFLPDADVTAQAAMDSFEAAELRRALDAVGEPQRSTLLLAYAGGLSHAEISRRTGVPLGTVKTRIRDGIARLRTHLGVSR